MKRSLIIFFKAMVLLVGIVVLAGMIWFPLTEGRAVNLDLVSIYWDPFIVYMYVAAIPFFVALYQAYKLLGLIGQDKVFSLSSVKAFRSIKYCALAVAGFIVVGELCLIITQHGKDDMAGPISLGIITTVISIVIAVAMAVVEKLLQNVKDIKSENDLTV